LAKREKCSERGQAGPQVTQKEGEGQSEVKKRKERSGVEWSGVSGIGEWKGWQYGGSRADG
jgi:hypothetical protein